MKSSMIKNECIEPEVGLYVIDWQQGWLDTGQSEDTARKQAVETHLMQCSACMGGVAMMDELKAVLRQHPDLLDDPERYLRAERPALIPRWRAVAALAAGLLLGVTITLSWRMGGGSHPPGEDWFSAVSRKAATDPLAEARAAYTSGRYGDVVAQLQQVAKSGTISAEGLYYLGLSYAGLGQRKQACEKLAQAANDSIGNLHEDALWALAQSLVADGQPGAARVQLEALAKSPRYGARAATLAQTLRKGTLDADVR